MKNRILYVEDNALNMSLIRKMFRLMNYELIEARDGITGIARAASEQPDLILMDINLPDLPGWEVARQIKASPLTAHMPIITLTSDISSESARRSKEAGCEAYLNKPVSRALLLRTIQQFLNVEVRN